MIPQTLTLDLPKMVVGCLSKFSYNLSTVRSVSAPVKLDVASPAPYDDVLRTQMNLI